MKNKDKLFIILIFTLLFGYYMNVTFFSKTYAIVDLIVASIVGLYLIVRYGDDFII